MAKKRAQQTKIAGLANRGASDGGGYSRNVHERVGLLEGLSEERMNAALRDVHLRNGAWDPITALREADVHVAIITETVTHGVETVLDSGGVTVDTIVDSIGRLHELFEERNLL